MGDSAQQRTRIIAQLTLQQRRHQPVVEKKAKGQSYGN